MESLSLNPRIDQCIVLDIAKSEENLVDEWHGQGIIIVT